MPTIALLAVAWLMSTRLRRIGSNESLVPALAFTATMITLLYLRRFH